MKNHNDDRGIFYILKSKISDFFYNASVDLHDITSKDDVVKVKKNSKTYYKNNKRKELLCILSVLIIPLINLCVFWVWGTLKSIPIAFEHWDTDGKVTYDFFNFQYLFDSFREPNSIFFESIINTLKYWALGGFICMPLSYIMGFFLYKKIFAYKVFRYIFFIPSLLSSVIVATCFKYMVGPDGPIPAMIELLTNQKDILLLADSRYAIHTMLFFNFYTSLTGNLLYWLANFSRIPTDVLEAGKLDGLTTWGEFVHIIFPISFSFYMTMFLLYCTGILSASGPALLLTGGAYGTYDIGFYEYMLTISGAMGDQGISGAIGLLKGVIVLPLALIINKGVSKIETVDF